MHDTNSRLEAVIPNRTLNSDSIAERVDPGVDLQIADNSNRQKHPRRAYRPTFQVRENQLITDILQKSTDPRNRLGFRR